MKLTVRKPAEINYIGRQIERDIRGFLTIRIVTAITEFQRAIMERTPVYTGRTLINYRWSIGAPIQEVRKPIADPRLPGVTSDLALGQEPRRAPNQAIVEGELQGMVTTLLRSRNPFVRIFLTNNVPHFDEVEYGSYSDEARTPPGGMVRAGEKRVQAILRGARRG